MKKNLMKEKIKRMMTSLINIKMNDAEFIGNEGYTKYIMIKYADDTVYYVGHHSAKITMDGIEFLEQNVHKQKRIMVLKKYLNG